MIPSGQPSPAAPGRPNLPIATPADERTIFEGRPALLPSIVSLGICVITLGLALLWFWIRRSGTSYRITTQRIVVDSGMFSKTLEQLDLYRINDFQVDRPFGQRLMGTGNIRLHTFDKTTPNVTLYGLKTDVVQLYEQMRAAVDTAKRQQGVRMVDYES